MNHRQAMMIAKWCKTHLVRREELDEAKKTLEALLGNLQESLKTLDEEDKTDVVVQGGVKQ